MQTELTLQEKLKDLRMERKLTLEQLAEQTKLSRSALGNYESDEERDISPFALKTLAKFYDVSTDYLLGLTEGSRCNTKIQGVANEVKTIYETNQFGVTNVRNCINILGFGDCGITNDHIKGIIRFVMLLNKWQLKARQRKRNKLRRKGLPAGN